MLLNEDAIQQISIAFEAGMNVPKTYFSRAEAEESGNKVVYINPLWITKPEGIEFTYIVYWTGTKFRGGYISINNNYSGVQRGRFDRNGETLIVSHIHELRKCYKKILPEYGWIAYSFIMDDKNKIFFWGKDNIEHFYNPIENLTGLAIEDLETIFLNDEKMSKPHGFVASAMVYDENFNKLYIHTSKVKDTITQAWKSFYIDMEDVDEKCNFTIGLDNYMRKAYAILMSSNKLY